MFDFLKSLFSDRPPTCPNCGTGYAWDGKTCTSCNYPDHAEAAIESATEVAGQQNPFAESPVSSAVTPEITGPPKSTTITGLDADKFSPISEDEALSQTRSVNWKTAYWDSTSVIPPADLPRIQVIDQTMVGLGLISAEELARIHQLGEEFGQFQSNFGEVAHAGEVAVEQNRAARQQNKQRKKQEAEQRRQEHAQAVAHRKATDIVFLGRGVSRGLADRKAHVEKLQANGLPVLAKPIDLAKAMEIEIPKLRWLAFHNDAARRIHYVHFSIPKKSGGQRVLAAPHASLEQAQRWILENVLRQLNVHPQAHGFAPGRSIKTNAQPHVGASVVVNCDLKDFFPTINFFRVEGMFRAVGYSPAIATIMSLLCTESPRQKVKFQGQDYWVATGRRALPQGACTSPAISNQIAMHLDVRLAGMAKKLGWIYSRYADDLTLSWHGDAEGAQVGYLLARIRHIAKDEGFEVNESKTRVLRNHTQQAVTGIVVNDAMGVSRKTRKRIRAIIHNAKQHGLESQNRDGRENFLAWLEGMISHIESVNPAQGKKLKAELAQLVTDQSK